MCFRRLMLLALGLVALSSGTAHADSLIGSACTELGATRMDTNEENIVACLRSGGGLFWKGSTGGEMESMQFPTWDQTSGYQRFPNGMIIQWRRSTVGIATDGCMDVPYPIPFPHGAVNIQVATAFNNYFHTADNRWFQVGFIGNTYATICAQAADGLGPSILYPMIFAIGY